jgi:hypothetical protein
LLAVILLGQLDTVAVVVLALSALTAHQIMELLVALVSRQTLLAQQ